MHGLLPLIISLQQRRRGRLIRASEVTIRPCLPITSHAALPPEMALPTQTGRRAQVLAIGLGLLRCHQNEQGEVSGRAQQNGHSGH